MLRFGILDSCISPAVLMLGTDEFPALVIEALLNPRVSLDYEIHRGVTRHGEPYTAVAIGSVTSAQLEAPLSKIAAYHEWRMYEGGHFPLANWHSFLEDSLVSRKVATEKNLLWTE